MRTNRGHITGSRQWQEWDEMQPMFPEIPKEVHPDPLPREHDSDADELFFEQFDL